MATATHPVLDAAPLLSLPGMSLIVPSSTNV